MDADLAFAQQLQAQFDRELIELSDDDETDQKVVVSLDDSDVVEVKPTVSKKPQRPSHDPDVVLCESRLNLNTYYVAELHKYIDRQYNADFEFVTDTFSPKLDSIYERLKLMFFGAKLDGRGLVVKWRRTMGNVISKNFIDDDGCYTVWLNEPVLSVRPRIELCSVLLVSTERLIARFQINIFSQHSSTR
jgi:hypothetical protein